MRDTPHSEYEESDFFDDRKEGRKERKLAQRLDRSKYKKTDQDKAKVVKEPPPGSLKTGRVIKILSADIIVDSEGKQFTCTLRGALKKEKSQSKSIVIVGDIVQFGEDNAIYYVEERKTVLSRADNLSQQREHLIAANVDLVLITVSVVDPPLRPPIIDRYLIAAMKGGLRPVIICNKLDLLNDEQYESTTREKEAELLDVCKKMYKEIGIPFLTVSSQTGEGIDELKKLMKDHISVFSGQSGSGKSSLINAAFGLDIKVGKTVSRSRKGAHTTSIAELYPLSFGGYVVDTPGIKSFGIWNLEVEDLRGFFTEFSQLNPPCKFTDCYHRGETGCAVPEAIEKGLISQLRYDSYLNILQSLESEHFRR